MAKLLTKRFRTYDPSSEISCVDRDEGDLLTDPNHCNKFYICIQGLPKARTCPEGTLFNRETAKCERSYDVVCPAGKVKSVCHEIYVK